MAEQTGEYGNGDHHETIDALSAGVPRAVSVTPANADELWSRRRELFFKPVSGYASRGVYRGAGLTKRVWQSIVASDYIAQALVAPSERRLQTEGDARALKLDVRCYVYAVEALLVAARMYQGQTTNLRTEGGGLASVFTARSPQDGTEPRG